MLEVEPQHVMLTCIYLACKVSGRGVAKGPRACRYCIARASVRWVAVGMVGGFSCCEPVSYVTTSKLYSFGGCNCSLFGGLAVMGSITFS